MARYTAPMQGIEKIPIPAIVARADKQADDVGVSLLACGNIVEGNYSSKSRFDKATRVRSHGGVLFSEHFFAICSMRRALMTSSCSFQFYSLICWISSNFLLAHLLVTGQQFSQLLFYHLSPLVKCHGVVTTDAKTDATTIISWLLSVSILDKENRYHVYWVTLVTWLINSRWVFWQNILGYGRNIWLVWSSHALLQSLYCPLLTKQSMHCVKTQLLYIVEGTCMWPNL